MKHAGVHHVSLNVHDTEETAKFYIEVLGFDQIPRPDFDFPGSWLQCGEQQVHLIQVKKHQAPKGQHFALRVEDLDDARAELLGQGVKVSEILDIEDICRQCFFHDPAGNMIELNQPKH